MVTDNDHLLALQALLDERSSRLRTLQDMAFSDLHANRNDYLYGDVSRQVDALRWAVGKIEGFDRQNKITVPFNVAATLAFIWSMVLVAILYFAVVGQ